MPYMYTLYVHTVQCLHGCFIFLHFFPLFFSLFPTFFPFFFHFVPLSGTQCCSAFGNVALNANANAAMRVSVVDALLDVLARHRHDADVQLRGVCVCVCVRVCACVCVRARLCSRALSLSYTHTHTTGMKTLYNLAGKKLKGTGKGATDGAGPVARALAPSSTSNNYYCTRLFSQV